ncbi:MAG: iron-sulfur cluster biosynthesis family protein [Anaerovoracaceae bacterium]
MKITLTPAAKDELKKSTNQGLYMKIDIIRSGCCSYAFTCTASIGTVTDETIWIDEIPLAVSPRASEFLKKAVIDYKRKGLRKELQVQPN